MRIRLVRAIGATALLTALALPATAATADSVSTSTASGIAPAPALPIGSAQASEAPAASARTAEAAAMTRSMAATAPDGVSVPDTYPGQGLQVEIDPAGPPAGFDGFVVTAEAAHTSGDARAGGRVIRCWGNTDRPHRSNTNPRRANVHVWIQCTASVSQISVRGAIYRSGRLAGTSDRTHTTRGRKIARNHANTACRNNHVYGSWVGGTVVFPPRYTPPIGRISTYGKSARITNCP